MRIRLNEKQLQMVASALWFQYTDGDQEWDANEDETFLYDKITSALEKEKSGTSVSE